MIDCILVVGLGSIGCRHVRLAKEINPEIKVVVLRHSDCHGLPDIGVDHCVTNLEDALKYSPQAAVIASPATYHLDAALPLAQAGVHLLIEKPIASSNEGVAGLIDLCRERNITLMTGYNMRFLPSLQQLKKLLGDELCGRILSVRAEVGQYLPSWRPSSDYRQTVSAKAALGGGVLLELSHEIDYLRWLFGDVEWVSAIQRKQSALEIDVEDTAHLTLGFHDDNNEPQIIASLNMDFIRHDTTRTCTVIGDKASLRWNGIAGTIEIFYAGGEHWELLLSNIPDRDHTYREEIKHFIDCIENNQKPIVSGEDGVAAIDVVEAARQSSISNGQVVCLNSVRETES